MTVIFAAHFLLRIAQDGTTDTVWSLQQCWWPQALFAVLRAYLHAAGSTNIHARRINRKPSRQLRHLFAHALFDSRVTHMLEHIGDPTAHLLPLGFPHASRGYRGAAQAYSSTFHRRQWI